MKVAANFYRSRSVRFSAVEIATPRQAALFMMLLVIHSAWAQAPASPASSSNSQSKSPSETQPQTPPEASAQDSDAAAPRRDPMATSFVQGNKEAWVMLRNAAESSKPDMRIHALAALGTLNGSSQARDMVRKAFADPDLDVRVAAVVAVQTAKDRSMVHDLRKALDDTAPEVGFAAAAALWRMGDDAGKDMLFDVMDGERKAGSGLIKSNLHTANKDMHDPATLAAIGAKQGAYMLLGPFGVGLDAWDYIRKGTSGNSARVLAITLLSQKKNNAIRDQVVSVLFDKDPFVRTAAALALGDYHTSTVADSLLESFGDAKPGVRLIAAASYIRATGHAAAYRPGAIAKPTAKSAH